MDQPNQPSSWFDRPVWKSSSIRREHILWSALILAAVVSRFAMLEPRVISHDEGQHVQLAWSLYSGNGYTPNPMTHGPFQIIAVTASYFLFGAGDFSSRIPAALFGVAAVAILYLFRRWLGRTGALAAGGLMLISPYMLYYARYVRNESFVVVWGLLMIYAVGRYLECRQPRWLYMLAAVTALHYATKETAYIYAGLAVFFLYGYVQIQLLMQRWGDAARRRWYIFLAIMAVLLAAGAVLLISAGRGQLVDAALHSGVEFDPEEMVHTEIWIANPLVQTGLILFLLSLAGFGSGLWLLLKEFPPPVLRERFPAVDLLVVLGTTLLPQLSAFPMALFNLNPFDPYDGGPLQKIRMAEYILPWIGCLLVVAVPAVVLGLLWDRKKWAVYAGIFFGIYGFLFSVCLTNVSGVLMGLVGSVNYWMAQQEVNRGSQPWYYYILMQIPIYEFLPALLALSAPAVAWLARRKSPSAENGDPPAEGNGAAAESAGGSFWKGVSAAPIPWLIGYWCVAALPAFTAAGEKMPWLTVHITLPFILLGGWVVGLVVERGGWARVLVWPQWTGLLILPAVLAAAMTGAGMFLAGPRPFSGSTLDELSTTGDFIFFILVAAAGVGFLSWLWREMRLGTLARVLYLGAALLLALLTVRTAWRASYIEYDNATEFLVYAHGAPGVKTAMSQIEEISRKTRDDLGIRVPYDVRSGWLVNWYLREYPNAVNFGEQLDRSLVDAPVVIVGDFYWQQADRLLSDTHYAFTYMRMWWPMMDYFDLTWDRIASAVGDPAYRSALWQIWFNRDYTEYGRLTGGDFSLANWPSGERMRLYVRKDLAVQVWQYGSEAFTPPMEVDPYAESVRTLEAAEIWSQAGVEEGSLQRPRGIAAAADGSVYVADTFNHRIQRFDAGGNLLQAWGSYSGPDAGTAENGTFNEPWGIAVGPDGSVYVADTWNFRIQKFTAEGEYLDAWGSYTNSEDGYQLYGPRAVAVDSQGRVFVADTGNKRITVYDSDGAFLQAIGRPGFDAGQLDEPVGLAFGPGGKLYVADTWNRRIQVFQDYDGTFAYLTEWPIAGWEGQSTDTKPYLAVSPDGRIWVTDPGNARVLVFDLEGNFLYTFGAFGSDSASFSLPTGIAAGGDGRIYITDADNNRIMVFQGV
jgi:DNA-binding beta-propeller fold protein YncE